MKKILKRLVATLACVALAFSLFLPLAQGATKEVASVSANSILNPDTVQPGKLSDDAGAFEFEDGAGCNVSPYGLKFVVDQSDAWSDGRMNVYNEDAWMIFSLYRYNGDGETQTLKYNVCISYDRRSGSGEGIRTFIRIMVQEVEYDPEFDISSTFVGVEPQQLSENEITYSSDYANAKTVNFETYGTFRVLQEGFRTEDPNLHPFQFERSGTVPKFGIMFRVGSYKTPYFATLKYEMNLNDGYRSGELTSSVRSVYSVVSNINAAGAMEKEFDDAEDLAIAQEILANGSVQTVNVQYLEDIEDTYLAKKKVATISIPVDDNKIALDDVASALGKQSMVCQTAHVSGFKHDTEAELWIAEYYSAVWLRVKAVDGDVHVNDMFLDINLSYEEYFGKLSSELKAADGTGLYEYMFNQLVGEYPVLEGMDPYDVHGYFGVVWVPNRNDLSSLNTVAAELFNITTEETGFITSFNTPVAITYDQHTKLMSEYNYNWLAATWDKVLDFTSGKQTTARFYCFTAEPREYVGISDTENTDPKDDNTPIQNIPKSSIWDEAWEIVGMLGPIALIVGVAAAVVLLRSNKKKK